VDERRLCLPNSGHVPLSMAIPSDAQRGTFLGWNIFIGWSVYVVMNFDTEKANVMA